MPGEENHRLDEDLDLLQAGFSGSQTSRSEQTTLGGTGG